MTRLAAFLFTLVTLALPSVAQGPMILMGIDAEDFNISQGGHGGTEPYEDLLANGILPNVENGGSGMLVFGAGKDPNDDVTLFWQDVAADLGLAVTLVNGKANILAQALDGFAVVAIASSVVQTPLGGLTNDENDALTELATSIADHVNGGGGLFGTSQAGLSNPYGYLGPDFFSYAFPSQWDAVTPTAAGLALGITETNLDTCCWHDEYISFPGFFTVLATNDDTGNPCAIGGTDVVLVRKILATPKTSQCFVGETHTVTATLAENTMPIPNQRVRFEILDGPNQGLMYEELSNANGQAFFSYVGAGGVGTDTIRAAFVDHGEPDVAIVTKEWIDAAECFLVVGSGPGSSAWTSIGHTWQTQLSAVTQSYPATLNSLPSFLLPVQGGKPAAQLAPSVLGRFSVQMLLWNPAQFPTNPEQYSQGLEVTLWTDGRASARAFGVEDNMQISMQVFTDPQDGLRYVRFPFSITGF